MDYMILSRSTTADLQVMVREYIHQGWVPQGGIATSDERGGAFGTIRFHQVMIRDRK